MLGELSNFLVILQRYKNGDKIIILFSHSEVHKNNLLLKNYSLSSMDAAINSLVNSNCIATKMLGCIDGVQIPRMLT